MADLEAEASGGLKEAADAGLGIGARLMNNRYGRLGWIIMPLNNQPGYAIYGCCDRGIPRFLSGFVTYTPDVTVAIGELLDQVTRSGTGKQGGDDG